MHGAINVKHVHGFTKLLTVIILRKSVSGQSSSAYFLAPKQHFVFTVLKIIRN